MIMDAFKKQRIREICTGGPDCIGLQWSLGENMIMVEHEGGVLSLNSTEEERMIMKFEK